MKNPDLTIHKSNSLIKAIIIYCIVVMFTIVGSFVSIITGHTTMSLIFLGTAGAFTIVVLVLSPLYLMEKYNEEQNEEYIKNSIEKTPYQVLKPGNDEIARLLEIIAKQIRSGEIRYTTDKGG